MAAGSFPSRSRQAEPRSRLTASCLEKSTMERPSRTIFSTLLTTCLLFSLSSCQKKEPAAPDATSSAEAISPEEARAIGKEAYIYGFPLVDNYRIQYSYFVDTGNTEYKAPWNQIYNNARVYTPDDK